MAYVKDAKQAKAPNEGGQPTFDDGGAATAQSMELAQAPPADAPASLDDVRAGRTLERGMRGEAVVELQKLLDIKAPGVFDDATRAAVEAFQAEHQLSPVSGVVGPTTLKVIEQVARDGVSPKAQAQMNRLVAIAESGHQGAALGDCFRFVWLYITKAGYGDRFFHGIGHHIGLEVHDITPEGPLKAGAIITIEPGIYLPDENFGVRIEDDILITKDGHEVLTRNIPKSVRAIEKAMADRA